MNWKLDIREDALADIEAAAAWYEGQQPGLGAEFARTVRLAISALPENPPDLVWFCWLKKFLGQGSDVRGRASIAECGSA